MRVRVRQGGGTNFQRERSPVGSAGGVGEGLRLAIVLLASKVKGEKSGGESGFHSVFNSLVVLGMYPTHVLPMAISL